jgi:O-antigen ligase
VFVRPWQSFGIALATSLVYCCAMAVLLFALRRKVGRLDLLTPPAEMLAAVRRAEETMVSYVDGLRHRVAREARLVAEGGRSLFGAVQGNRAVACLGIAATALMAGIASSYVNLLVALVVVLAVPVALIALRYPYAVLLLVAVTYALVGSPFPSVNHLDWVLIPLMLLVLPQLQIRRAIKYMPAVVILAIFILWILAGIGVSPLDNQSFLRLWIVYVSYVAVSLLTVCTVTTRRRLMALIDIILLTSGLIALFGIFGYFTRQYGVYDTQVGAFRTMSVFASAPGLALFLCMALPLAAYRAVTSRGLGRAVVLLVSAVLLVAIMMTFSREILISVPVSIAVAALCLPSRRARYGLLAGMISLVMLVVGATLVAGLPVLDRFASADTASFNGRTYLWSALLERFDPGHIFGYGLDAGVDVLTKMHIGDNGLVWNGLIANSPSNLFVQVLYDHGIIGLLLVLGIFGALFVGLLRGLRTSTSERYALFAAALVTLLIMIFESLEQSDFMTQQIAIYFWIVMALPFALHWTQPREATLTAAPSLSRREAGVAMK